MQPENDNSDYQLTKKELLELLFDFKYGKLNGSWVLTKDEYNRHKRMLVD